IDADDVLTVSGMIAGTPNYMAPEQAAGHKSLTVAVDVYGLGAILYEGLTGRPPFQGANVCETLVKVRDQEPARPSRVQPRVPRDLETICLNCLGKEPDKRYASAGEVSKELGRYLTGQPIHGRRVPTWERAVKWAKRKPAIALLTAAVILLTLGGTTAL